MTSDDYQVQNVFRYLRKTYKSRRGTHDDELDNTNNEIETSPVIMPDIRNRVLDSPGYSCDIDPDGEMTNLLHNKLCPVISLAEQQLRRIFDETDKMICNNTRCCRSMYEFLCLCREILNQSKCRCILIIMIVVSFFTGLLFGALSCGSYLGRFKSPLLDCVDNYFIPNTYPKIEDTYHSVV